MYLMYVDESGDTGFPPAGTPFPDRGGPTKYFVRAGVIVHDWKWWRANEAIIRFKRARNLSWDEEIRAHDLRAGKRAFKDWGKADRTVMLDDLLDSIGKEFDVTVIAIVIDKSKVDRAQRKRLKDPSVRSLELLLERYNSFLGKQKDRCGIVILDSVERQNDENLRYFQSFLREHSEHLDARRIIEGALFMLSHTTNFLQLADVCANVLYKYHTEDFVNPREYARIEPSIFVVKVWPT